MHWGRNKTVLVFSCLYLVGHGVLAAAANSLGGVVAGCLFVSAGAGEGCWRLLVSACVLSRVGWSAGMPLGYCSADALLPELSVKHGPGLACFLDEQAGSTRLECCRARINGDAGAVCS